MGDGPHQTLLRSQLGFDAPFDPNKDYVRITADFQSVENLTINGFRAAGTGVGIRLARPGTSDGLIYGARISNVRINTTPGYGIFVGDPDTVPPDPNAPIKLCVWTTYDNVEIAACGAGYGVRSITTTQYFKNCNFKDMGKQVDARPSPRPGSLGPDGLSFVDCIFDGITDTAVRLESTSQVQFVGCWFEGRQQPTTPVIDASGTYHGLGVSGCRFTQIQEPPFDNGRHLYAIRVAGKARSVLLSEVQIVLVNNTAPDAPPPPYHIVVEPPSGADPDAEVVIVGGSLMDPSGVEDETHRALRISSGSRRMTLVGSALRSRLVQLTTAERDLLRQPVAGDLIYNSTLSRFEYFDGAAWRFINNSLAP